MEFTTLGYSWNKELSGIQIQMVLSSLLIKCNIAVFRNRNHGSAAHCADAIQIQNTRFALTWIQFKIPHARTDASKWKKSFMFWDINQLLAYCSREELSPLGLLFYECLLWIGYTLLWGSQQVATPEEGKQGATTEGGDTMTGRWLVYSNITFLKLLMGNK